MVTEAKALVIGNYKGRHTVVRAFRNAGFHVSETVESLGGLKQILEQAPRIVILSHGRCQDQTRRMVRAARCLTSAPIVVIGNGHCPSNQQVMAWGADACLNRRLEPSTFLSWIHAVLSKN